MGSEGLANIISQRKLSRQYRITYDNWQHGERLFVHKGDGTALVFCAKAGGIHVYDTQDREIVPVPATPWKAEDEGVSLIKTVAANKEGYTKRQLVGGDTARRLYTMVGRPSIRDFKGLITGNLLKNCSVTLHDVNNAECIYGPDVGALKGKTVRKASPKVRTAVVNIPLEIKERHRLLTRDIMFVNKLPFVVTLSCGLVFGTARFVNTRSAGNLLKSIKKIFNFYSSSDYKITNLYMDCEFQHLCKGLKKSDKTKAA